MDKLLVLMWENSLMLSQECSREVVRGECEHPLLSPLGLQVSGRDSVLGLVILQGVEG